jgi:hypothetical protein
VLLFCENDKESQALFDYLNDKLSEQEKAQLKQINASTSLSEEQEHVEQKAGQIGSITISTKKLSRGTDIKLHDKTDESGKAKKNKGLKVLTTFLPRERDYKQMIGRSGRAGAEGETRLILNREKLPKDSANDSLFLTTEAKLEALQSAADSHEQKHRQIANYIDNVCMNYTHRFHGIFIEELYDHANDTELTNIQDLWKNFLKESDDALNTHKEAIDALLLEKTIDYDEVNEELTKYQETLTISWNLLIAKTKDALSDKRLISHLEEPTINLPQPALGTLQVPASPTERSRPKVVKEYDRAFAGKPVLYENYGQAFRAWLNKPWFDNLRAWYNGEGLLNPRWDAYQKDKITFREMITGVNSSKEPELDDKHASSTTEMPTGVDSSTEQEFDDNHGSSTRDAPVPERTYARLLSSIPPGTNDDRLSSTQGPNKDSPPSSERHSESSLTEKRDVIKKLREAQQPDQSDQITKSIRNKTAH